MFKLNSCFRPSEQNLRINSNKLVTGPVTAKTSIYEQWNCYWGLITHSRLIYLIGTCQSETEQRTRFRSHCNLEAMVRCSGNCFETCFFRCGISTNYKCYERSSEISKLRCLRRDKKKPNLDMELHNSEIQNRNKKERNTQPYSIHQTNIPRVCSMFQPNLN